MYKHLEKEKVEEELPSFSMLVMKCSAASPILKHCAKHGRRIMSLDPHGEFVDCYQQVGEAPGRLLQRADEVQPPHGKRPRDGDGLQSVGWEVRLLSVELATLAGPHDVGGVIDRSGPVKALPKRVNHE